MTNTPTPAWPAQHGVTGPLSTAMPEPKDQDLNNQLVEELKREKNFESPEDTEKRKRVLQELQAMTTELVKTTARKKGLPASVAKDAEGQVFTFGSYYLGVYGPGSDIDTLIVCPKHVSREDFFTDFPDIMHRMAPKGAVGDMKAVPDAYVPIIKLVYSGIEIDLCFARLLDSSISASIDLKINDHLRGLDELDQRCVNGKRVTDEMLALVPQKKTFRHTLRAIKLWAQRRAIYANIMGFPGGVAWALMVARICQMYPNAVGSRIVGKFFHLMSRWQWPKPVMLKAIEEGPFPARIWNPIQNRSDSHHLMPIITPAFPSMCATHNITSSTKKVILKELERAKAISDQILDGKLGWSALFEKHTFFTKDFKYYLSVICASRTKESQQKWSGLVESKVRRLVSSIEQSQGSIEIARPFTKGFERIFEVRTEQDIDDVLRGELRHLAKDNETTTTDVTKDPIHEAVAAGNLDKVETNGAPNGSDSKTAGEATRLFSTTYYVGIELANGAEKSMDISFSTNEFIRQCREWQSYDDQSNMIKVVFLRSHQLPDDVFDQGEQRPVHKKKKAKKNVEAQKRSFSQSGMDGTPDSASKRPKESDSGASSNNAVAATAAG